MNAVVVPPRQRPLCCRSEHEGEGTYGGGRRPTSSRVRRPPSAYRPRYNQPECGRTDAHTAEGPRRPKHERALPATPAMFCETRYASWRPSGERRGAGYAHRPPPKPRSTKPFQAPHQVDTKCRARQPARLVKRSAARQTRRCVPPSRVLKSRPAIEEARYGGGSGGCAGGAREQNASEHRQGKPPQKKRTALGKHEKTAATGGSSHAGSREKSAGRRRQGRWCGSRMRPHGSAGFASAAGVVTNMKMSKPLPFADSTRYPQNGSRMNHRTRSNNAVQPAKPTATVRT
jgi:hypothetical protein